MAKISTNALTKRYCEMRGWPWAPVQFFAGGRRHDLFGIADAIVFKPTERWIQNCAYGTVQAHLDKCRNNPIWGKVYRKVEFWEWKKKRGIGGYFLRRLKNISDANTSWEGPIDL